jgi:hypothetical protein
LSRSMFGRSTPDLRREVVVEGPKRFLVGSRCDFPLEVAIPVEVVVAVRQLRDDFFASVHHGVDGGERCVYFCEPPRGLSVVPNHGEELCEIGT